MANNPFRRFAYSPVDTARISNLNKYPVTNEQMQVFSGGDLHAYINDIKVGNLESVTWTVSVEVVGNYVMGRRDAVTYATGKRVLVGSMVFSQYDRHAILQQVFNLSNRGVNTLGDAWALSEASLNSRIQTVAPAEATAAVKSLGSAADKYDGTASSYTATTFGNMRGLSPDEYRAQLADQIRNAAETVAATRFNYSDQIPPFDLTLVGVNKTGAAAKCTIFGMQITQETGGYSQNDMGNSVGVSYVALSATPWTPLDAAVKQAAVSAAGVLYGVK